MHTQPTLPGYEWSQTDPREWALAQGMMFHWDDDWSLGVPHSEEYPDAYDAEPSTCEYAELRDSDDNVLASLHCIDDADADYRETVERDLAAEVMP